MSDASHKKLLDAIESSRSRDPRLAVSLLRTLRLTQPVTGGLRLLVKPKNRREVKKQQGIWSTITTPNRGLGTAPTQSIGVLGQLSVRFPGRSEVGVTRFSLHPISLEHNRSEVLGMSFPGQLQTLTAPPSTRSGPSRPHPRSATSTDECILIPWR